ncbi:MAG: hypothetical protein K6U12_10370 [Armatimonadetes bacterium]|nr:hypothetical protein [Armatimonadota bacterium]
MSGVKYSGFRLRQEREQRMRLLQEINTLSGELRALQTHLQTTIDNASEGLRTTFSDKVAQAQAWLRSLTFPNTEQLDMSTDTARLNEVRQQLNQIAARGRQLQETLTFAFTQKADEMGRRLAQQLATAEQVYLGRQELLRLWFGEQTTQNYEQRLSEARRLLDAERYSELEPSLNAFQSEVARQSQEAEQLEEKHQKRLYLLKALRQVCADMGFREITPPRFEEEDNRRSRILFTVDTFDRGRIEFKLSLEQVSAFSEIASDRCFEEFDELSQFLDEAFGIQTEFRMKDGTSPSDLSGEGGVKPSGNSSIGGARIEAES